jgi:hypothetical protein
MGLKEVARIKAEMEQVKASTGFKGDMPAFLKFLRTDPQFYPKTPYELLAKSSYVAKRMDAKLPETIGFLPRRRFAILPVPPALAPIYTGGRGGLESCLMNTYDLPSRPLYTLTALTIHECNPGHSFQSAVAQEATRRPAFRRATGFSGYGEGWALYWEWMGSKLGMYETPYEDFGRLSYEMWRASRLVIDTGLHHYGWSRQQAQDYLRGNTALSEHDDHDRDRSLYRMAGTGTGVQTRRAQLAQDAQPCRGGTGRGVRPAALPRHLSDARLGAAAGDGAEDGGVHCGGKGEAGQGGEVRLSSRNTFVTSANAGGPLSLQNLGQKRHSRVRGNDGGGRP